MKHTQVYTYIYGECWLRCSKRGPDGVRLVAISCANAHVYNRFVSPTRRVHCPRIQLARTYDRTDGGNVDEVYSARKTFGANKHSSAAQEESAGSADSTAQPIMQGRGRDTSTGKGVKLCNPGS